MESVQLSKTYSLTSIGLDFSWEKRDELKINTKTKNIFFIKSIKNILKFKYNLFLIQILNS